MSLSFNIHDWNTDGAGPRMNVGALPDALRGVTVQTYLAKVPGNTSQERRATLLAAMKSWRALGAVGWAPHGFTESLPADVPAYADMAKQAGLLCVPAFGLNESDPRGKGDRIAVAAKVPGVAAVILDAEGAWEGHGGQFDAAAAVQMGAELTGAVPGVVLIQQPWPQPQSHRGYPEVAFTRYASANAPQDYFGPYAKNYGTRRVRVMAPRFDANWVALERDVLAPSGSGGVPVVTTFEGYGYSDTPYDYAAYVVARETIIFWSEWAPDPTCVRALAARQRLDGAVSLRVGGAWSGGDVVLRFQRFWNARPATPAASRLAEDGAYGPKTEAALFAGP